MAKPSVINAKIGDIQTLFVYPLTAIAKAMDAKRVARIDNCVVILGVDDKLYSNCITQPFYYSGVLNSRIMTLVETVAKLGVLDKEATAQFKADQETHRKSNAAKYAAEQVLENAEAAGIKLSPKQKVVLQEKVNVKS